MACQTVKGAQGILRTIWDETWHILEKAVARGKARKTHEPMPRIGIDEKAFRKGQNYITLIYDLDRSTVEAIAMDMSAAFVKSAKQNIALAETKIVHDRFHVMKLASEAVEKIRRGEHRQLKQEGDDRLTGTRYLWLTSQENLTDDQKARFDLVYKQELETGKAWAYKEMLRDLWHHGDAGAATLLFHDWYRRVIHTKLDPLKKVEQDLLIAVGAGHLRASETASRAGMRAAS